MIRQPADAIREIEVLRDNWQRIYKDLSQSMKGRVQSIDFGIEQSLATAIVALRLMGATMDAVEHLQDGE